MRRAARTRIQVRGVRTRDEASAAVDAGVDAVAFVFDPAAPEHVAPRDAYVVMALLPPYVASVGVFRDATLDEFSRIEEICPTMLTQFEGTQTPRLVRQCGPGLIRVVAFDPETIASELATWDALDEVDAILVDVGGSVPETLPRATEGLSKPLILGGAFNAASVRDAVRTLRPYAVQVAWSDGRELGALCRAVREADE